MLGMLASLATKGYCSLDQDLWAVRHFSEGSMNLSAGAGGRARDFMWEETHLIPQCMTEDRRIQRNRWSRIARVMVEEYDVVLWGRC